MEEKFLHAFKEALEIDRNVTFADEFRNYAEWDSIAHMSLIAMLDSEFGIQIESTAFDKCQTIKDIFEQVKAKSI